jgi:hypothetical protein
MKNDYSAQIKVEIQPWKTQIWNPKNRSIYWLKTGINWKQNRRPKSRTAV